MAFLESGLNRFYRYFAAWEYGSGRAWPTASFSTKVFGAFCSLGVYYNTVVFLATCIVCLGDLQDIPFTEQLSL